MIRSLLSAALAVAFLGAVPSATPARAADPALNLPPPGEAPSFPIRFADGREGTLADYRGQVVVVTFWQAHCGFCRVEMPHLNALAEDMADEGLVVAALSLDQRMEEVTGYLDQHGYGALTPTQDVQRINGTFFSLTQHGTPMIATPTQYVIDKSGKIVDSIFGAGQWQTEERRAWLRDLMNAPEA